MRTLPDPQIERLARAESFGRITRSAPVSVETYPHLRVRGIDDGLEPVAVPTPSAAVLHQAARAERSRRIGEGFAVALRWLQQQLIKHAERRRRHALARATYRALSALDRRTLHDLGIDRSQLSSVALGIARGSVSRSPNFAAIASIPQ